MRRWRLGANASDYDRTYTHAFVVEFDTLAELRAYFQSETHKLFVREQWGPNVAARVMASFEHDLGATPSLS